MGRGRSKNLLGRKSIRGYREEKTKGKGKREGKKRERKGKRNEVVGRENQLGRKGK